MKGFAKIAAVLVATTLIAGACSKKSSTTAAPSAGASMASAAASTAATTGVVYTAHEFGFDGPSTLPAGTSAITLTNGGAQDHEMLLVQVDAAHSSWTEDQVVNYVKTSGPNSQPKWATIVGGVVPPIPNGQSAPAVFGDLTAKNFKPNPNGSLGPGTYFFMCFVTDPTTKAPHAAMGMVKKVTVS